MSVSSQRLLIYAPSAGEYTAPLKAVSPDLDIFATTDFETALAAITTAEILFITDPLADPRLFAAAPRLKWIQVLTTGTDKTERAAGAATDLVMTAARGFHGPQMSELAFLMMLGLTRDARHLLAAQADHRWDRREPAVLWQKTLAIVGVGSIAEALAARCKAFDMRVVGVTATPRDTPYFDEMVARSEIARAFAQADYVVVLAPLTANTRHLVDDAAFRALPPHAIFLNLARGGVVDDDALLAALQEKRIAGAGLDVFAVEPLAPESQFWDLPNVIITPHVGGQSRAYRQQVLPILLENLQHYLNGDIDRLLYPVTRKKGGGPA